MEEILRELAANRIYLITAILVLSIIIYFILKRLIKLLVILLIAVLLYAAFFYYKDGKLPGHIEKVRQEEMKNFENFGRIKNTIIETVKTKDTLSETQSRDSSSE